MPINYKDQDFGPKVRELASELKRAGVRVHVDETNKNPGWKFAEWELKGVPLRIELGPKDFKKEQVMLVRRDTGEKSFCAWADMLPTVQKMLEDIHTNLFNK